MSDDPLANIIFELAKMPGIGHKTAQRLAFYILGLQQEDVLALSQAIVDVKENVHFCEECFFITYKEKLCSICNNSYREKTKICIVSDSKDLIALEKMGQYKGLYHVLGGVISPLDGIGPEQLRIKELLERFKTTSIEEVIFALTPSIEGETTTMYLKRLLHPLGLNLSQIAYGIPLGSDLEWADSLTLSKAFQGRQKLDV